jgi:hypothetical protein
MPKHEEPPPPSYARLIHVSPGCKMIDVYLDSHMVAKKFGFKKYTAYYPIIPGHHTIDVYRSGKKDNPMAVLDINLKQDFIYTIVIEGSQANRILLVHDPLTECTENTSEIRFINVSPMTPAVDITTTDNNVLFDHLSYRSIPGYTELCSGKHTFQVKRYGGVKPELTIPAVELRSGWNYTVYITGVSPDSPCIHWITLIDGNTYISKKEQNTPGNISH